MSAAPSGPDISDLYRQHHRRIYRYCLRHLGNPADAEDATQETFARMVVRLPRISGDAAPYLSAIAHNVCYDMRAEQRRRHTADAPFDDLGHADAGPGPEDTTADSSLLNSVVRALNRRERAMLLQTYAGYSYQEIAARMGLTVKVVSVSIVRARQRLRRIGAGGLVSVGAGALVQRLQQRAGRRVATLLRRLQPDGLAAVQESVLVVSSLALLVATGTTLPAAVAQLPRHDLGGFTAAPAPAARPAIGPVHRAEVALSGQTQLHAAAPSRQDHAPGALPDQIVNLPWTSTDENDVAFDSFTPSPAYSSDHTIVATGDFVAPCAPCGVLFTSTDSGATWGRASGETGYPDGPVILLPSYALAHDIYAVTTVGLQHSDDSGASFKVVAPLPYAVASPIGDGGEILVASREVAGNLMVYDAAATPPLRAGPSLPGAVADAMAALPDGQGVVIVTHPVAAVAGTPTRTLTRCTLLGCDPLGGTVESTSTVAIAVSPSYGQDHTLAVTGDDAAGNTLVQVSTDGGHTLRTVLRGDSLHAATALALAPGAVGVPVITVGEWAYTTAAGVVSVLRSTDGGASFTTASVFEPGVAKITALGARPDGNLLASVAMAPPHPGGVRCSRDQGTTWSASC